ncbi:hypothetical protein COEREDRAFT_89692 [Coemansia reversa NRRL 1564]|uniref:Uncharacterized protein n=1 Tax=Coemansia reversa (strain ATCC 12441 / NRRL 1564) TaxID=763665 RepID=A0A2G5B2Q3_COERN|nr:hypothetical protein COEREDRAFT_89692 [Coemansia reversa NRRL 1564]|eukprot:PIA13286.1 hypothetical protein COEREDRAFT_89692 [Coemansia reversa NRRL 1564]
MPHFDEDNNPLVNRGNQVSSNISRGIEQNRSRYSHEDTPINGNDDVGYENAVVSENNPVSSGINGIEINESSRNFEVSRNTEVSRVENESRAAPHDISLITNGAIRDYKDTDGYEKNSELVNNFLNERRNIMDECFFVTFDVNGFEVYLYGKNLWTSLFFKDLPCVVFSQRNKIKASYQNNQKIDFHREKTLSKIWEELLVSCLSTVDGILIESTESLVTTKITPEELNTIFEKMFNGWN